MADQIFDLSKETPAVKMMAVELAALSIILAVSFRATISSQEDQTGYLAAIRALGAEQLSEQMPPPLNELAIERLNELIAEFAPGVRGH